MCVCLQLCEPVCEIISSPCRSVALPSCMSVFVARPFTVTAVTSSWWPRACPRCLRARRHTRKFLAGCPDGSTVPPQSMCDGALNSAIPWLCTCTHAQGLLVVYREQQKLQGDSSDADPLTATNWPPTSHLTAPRWLHTGVTHEEENSRSTIDLLPPPPPRRQPK